MAFYYVFAHRSHHCSHTNNSSLLTNCLSHGFPSLISCLAAVSFLIVSPSANLHFPFIIAPAHYQSRPFCSLFLPCVWVQACINSHTPGLLFCTSAHLPTVYDHCLDCVMDFCLILDIVFCWCVIIGLPEYSLCGMNKSILNRLLCSCVWLCLIVGQNNLVNDGTSRPNSRCSPSSGTLPVAAGTWNIRPEPRHKGSPQPPHGDITQAPGHPFRSNFASWLCSMACIQTPPAGHGAL